MIIILRFLLLGAIIYSIYRSILYVSNPNRKLELAREQKRYFFLDDQHNVRKNFLLTYKGVIFEGEKYLGTTENAFDVISIFIWPHSNDTLKGLVRDDFHFIEKKIIEHYPHAKMDWKSPVKEFLSNNKLR